MSHGIFNSPELKFKRKGTKIIINDYDDKDNRANASLLVGWDIVWWRRSPSTTALDDPRM